MKKPCNKYDYGLEIKSRPVKGRVAATWQYTVIKMNSIFRNKRKIRENRHLIGDTYFPLALIATECEL